MQLLTICGLLTLLWSASAAPQRNDWANIQYSESALNSSVTTRGHLLAQQLLGKKKINKIKSFISMAQSYIYERYGSECLNGVNSALQFAVACVKPTLNLDKLKTTDGTSIMDNIRPDNAASTLCQLIDLESTLICIRDVESRVQLACTRDQLIPNVARLLAAEVRMAARICRDGGKKFELGLSQMLGCPVGNAMRLNEDTTTCMQNSKHLMREQGTDLQSGMKGLLKVLQNMSRMCLGISEYERCVSSALALCSPLLADMFTDMVYEDLAQELCGDVLQKPTHKLVGATARKTGNEIDYDALRSAAVGAPSAAGVLPVVVVVALMSQGKWLS